MVDETRRETDTWDGARTEGPGSRIGPYTLLRRIGEGGFGVVFEAEQVEPVRRRVALKVIKLGMDTEEVIARFQAERQALAVMDHPNIARVFDAGATSGGRPYFVMEMVEGTPMSDYCDEHKLEVGQRLALFEQVCLAVQHAHTKGIIHRDLKPGNVLVSTHDGHPFAKVIDFGIAKAASGSLTDLTLQTGLNQVMGTPLYMSPEQAAGSADIDTRTDVYSLGVILYELLTGSTPVSRESLRSAVLAEVQRLVCEVDPPTPSRRLAQMPDSLRAVASQRASSPGQLQRQVHGELDWIVMKALEKDRERRYGTANGLAMDVRRYLQSEPVLAAPPSRAYRLRKFVRRHQALVAGTVLVALSLVGGMAAFAWQARIAAQRAAELEQVAKFQAEMLAQVDPTSAGVQLGEDVKRKFAEALKQSGMAEADRRVRTLAFERDWANVNATDAARELIDASILKPAVVAIDKQFAGQPLVAASLQQTLADRYLALGLQPPALALQARALATRRAQLGDDDALTLESKHHLALVLLEMNRLEESERLMREAWAGERRVLGPEAFETLSTANDVGYVLQLRGDLDGAEKIFRETLATSRRALGNDAQPTLLAVNNMALLLDARDNQEEAEPLFREALATLSRLNGPDHIDTMTAMNNMGFVLQNAGKYKEAEPYYRKALAARRRVLGENHPDTMQALNGLGGLLVSEFRPAEAEPYFRASLERSRRNLGEDNYQTMQALHNLGRALQDQGKAEEALGYFRQAYAARRRVLGPDVDATLISAMTLGNHLRTMGRLDEAEPLLREAQDGFTTTLGADHSNTLIAKQAMGQLLDAQGHYAQAEQLCAPIEAMTRKAFASEPKRISGLLLALGKARTGLGKFEAAEKDLLEAQSIVLETRGPAHRDAREGAQVLMALYTAWQAAAPAPARARSLDEWSSRLKQYEAAAASKAAAP
jgi:serine/threonine protein kinase/tetratricopeptide (TPR) repeat protein